jgi:hypothetical protein
MDEILRKELIEDVTQTAEALGKISEDETTFRLLVESFRAQDHEAFHELLTRFGLINRCHFVCRWLCSKECALICFQLCGPPPKEPPRIDLREFGEMILKITSDREILCHLASAVTERDERAFRAIVEKLGVAQYCHYIHHRLRSFGSGAAAGQRSHRPVAQQPQDFVCRGEGRPGARLRDRPRCD